MAQQVKGKNGIIYALLAFLIWGTLIPILINALKEFAPIILIHSRVLIAAPIFLIILKLAGKTFYFSLKDMFLPLNVFATVILGIHWLLFIYCVNNGMSYQASFGYYLCPLLVACCGALIFKEPISKQQLLAICFATLGVIVLGSSLDSFPWLAILIAITFAMYAMSGKYRKGNALTLSSYELWTLFLIGLVALPLQYESTINSYVISPILIVTLGIFTALPVWLYREAAEKIPLSRLGFLQYTAPTLQLLTGVLYLKEPWDLKKLFAFILIWIGLYLFLKPPQTTISA